MKRSRKRPKEMMILTFGDESMSLEEKKCLPCSGEVPAMNLQQIKPLLAQLNEQWKLVEEHHLEREFLFDDFATALDFVNSAGEICEQENHHADFHLSWGKVKVSIWTHKIDGLAEADFILAAKIEKI